MRNATYYVVAIHYRRFGTAYRVPSSGFKNSKGWDRQVVPKRRYEISTTRCVITQQGAVLNDQAYLPPRCRSSLWIYGLKFCKNVSFLKSVMHALPIFLYLMITTLEWRQQTMNLFVMPLCPALPSFSLDPDILFSKLFCGILNLRFHFFWDMTVSLYVISLPSEAPSNPRSNL